MSVCLRGKTLARVPACCLLVVLLLGCGPASGTAPATGAAPASDGSPATAWSGVISPSLGITMEWKHTDLTEDYDPDQVVLVQLQGDRITVTGDGADAQGSTLTITAPGTYLISGELTNGQILVDADGDAKVRLVLNGVTVANDHTAPLYVINADKTVITLAAGTVSTFTDGAAYQFAPGEDDPKGAVFSTNDLTINGQGTLVVNGNYRHGIVSKDNLKIVNATVVVTAVHHALKGNDLVAIGNAHLTLRAGADGIHSDTTGDPTRGFIYIESGTIDIEAGSDGIQAESSLVVMDGDIRIVAGGSSSAAPVRVAIRQQPGRQPGFTPPAAVTPTAGSYKGLKSRAETIIHDGRITIDSRDDSIHSDGTIIIHGGTFTLSTGDDGIHADKSIVINGGHIEVLRSYEGIESSSVTINGGNIRIKASNDGVNGAGRRTGAAAAAGGPRPGPGGFGGMGANVHELHITGGYIFVDADGDGTDVNGSITMTGGTVIINGPLTQMEGALDFDVSFVISGGTLIASGSRGMAQAPSSARNQGIISFSVGGVGAGTIISIQDEQGVSVLTYSAGKQFESLVFSAPAVVASKTYTVYSGGFCAGGTKQDGVYTGGTYSGGTKLGTLTATSGETAGRR